MTEVRLQDATHDLRTRTFFTHSWPLYVHELCSFGERSYTRDASGLYRPNLVPFWLARVTPNLHLREPRMASDPRQPFARGHVLLRADEPIGFVCLAQPPFRYMPADAERCLAELFVVPAARGTGVALAAARAAVRCAPGARWYLRVLARNQPALRFWTRALSALGARCVTQAAEGDAVSFRFQAPG